MDPTGNAAHELSNSLADLESSQWTKIACRANSCRSQPDWVSRGPWWLPTTNRVSQSFGSRSAVKPAKGSKCVFLPTYIGGKNDQSQIRCSDRQDAAPSQD